MAAMMKVGIVDADLVSRPRHRFPNLASEKLSAYWKAQGAETTLLLDWEHLNDYDQVFVSKVFTDTPVPEWLAETDRIHLGGTGLFFDRAAPLPYEIEHHMPDYHLYDEWLKTLDKPAREFTDYSIGFLTRGCFRKCGFCVNQKYSRVIPHSPLREFFDPTRKKICLLDDNFLGCPLWKEMLQDLIDTGRPFKFKQGLDERLLTDEKCEMLFSARYDGEYTFAFDKIEDYNLIQKQLEMIRRHTNTSLIKFYVLVGYESTGVEDLVNAFRRIELLMRYNCLPYVMRYQSKNDAPWKSSPVKDMYTHLARWANQPGIIRNLSFREWVAVDQKCRHSSKPCASLRTMTEFERNYPEMLHNTST